MITDWITLHSVLLPLIYSRIYSFRFRPRETGFLFFAIHEICIYLHVTCEPMIFAWIIFHFFGDFSIIKAQKLHQTRCKTCPFDTLVDGGLSTNHSNSEPGRPRGFCRILFVMIVHCICVFQKCKMWIEFLFYVKHDYSPWIFIWKVFAFFFLWTWSCFSNFSWCMKRPISQYQKYHDNTLCLFLQNSA